MRTADGRQSCGSGDFQPHGIDNHTSVFMEQELHSCSPKKEILPPVGRKRSDLFHKKIHNVNFFVNRTYAVGSKPGMCLNKRPDSPPAGRKTPCFFTKMLHCVQHFCEKDKNVPCCRRRIGLPSGEMSRLHAHRVTPGEKEKSVPCCRRRIGLSSDETSRLDTHRVTPVT